MTIIAASPSPSPDPQPATAATRRPPSSHGSPDESPRAHARKVTFLVVLAVVIGAVDVILIVPIWNVILTQSAAVSWTMAVVTAIAAGLLAWSAGSAAAIGHIDRNLVHTLWAIVLAFVWVLLGAGISFLRWHTGDLTDTQIRTENTVLNDTANATHHILAVVLLALYLVPGALAAYHAYDLSNPVAQRARHSFATLTRLTHKLRHLEARAVEVEHLHAQHLGHHDRIDAGTHQAHSAADALADELKAYARERISLALQNPAHVPGPGTSAAAAADEQGHGEQPLFDPADPAGREGQDEQDAA